jgi:hypothetical protein
VSRSGRRAIAAEALATVSMALVTSGDAADRAAPRRALFAWVFNPGTRNLGSLLICDNMPAMWRADSARAVRDHSS